MFNTCSNAFNEVKEIYGAVTLEGEVFLQPLKLYHGHMIQRIDHSENSLPWRIAHVVTGIFAYPLFGLLATVGMFIKLTEIPSIKSNNEEKKNDLSQRMFWGCTIPGNYCNRFSIVLDGNLQANLITLEEITFKIENPQAFTEDDKTNILNEINTMIDKYKYRKVYFKTEGTWDRGVKFQLLGNLSRWESFL